MVRHTNRHSSIHDDIINREYEQHSNIVRDAWSGDDGVNRRTWSGRPERYLDDRVIAARACV